MIQNLINDGQLTTATKRAKQQVLLVLSEKKQICLDNSKGMTRRERENYEKAFLKQFGRVLTLMGNCY